MGPITTNLSAPPPPPPADDNSDEMTLHGLNNARSRYTQTILLGPTEIHTFLTTLHLPIPATLPPRIDIPRGLSFTAFLSARLHTPVAPMPARTRPWDIRMPLPWLYPGAGGGHALPPHKLWASRLRPGRTPGETAAAVAALLHRISVSGPLQFRGTTRWDAERAAVAAFGPARVEPTDLGPGVYTTGSLELAVAYAGGCAGVVWVFAEAAAWRAVTVARVEGAEWVCVAGGRGARGGAEDVLVGAVSDDRGPAGLQGCEAGRVDVVPMEGGAEWLCWRSRKAWGALGMGLVALVYLEDLPEVVYEGWTVAE